MENSTKRVIKSIIAVPARLESSRLPNKVIADIGGKPMLLRVLNQCRKSENKTEIVLCTDSKKLAELAEDEWNYDVIMTSKDCTSGSERIASVTDALVKKAWGSSIKNKDNLDNFYKNTLIINIQGDQPFLDPNVIDLMINNFKSNNNDPEVITPIYKLSKKDIHNSAVVKTLISRKGNVIYFSRSPLPHIRDVPQKEWHKHADYWGHVGMYGYRADILKKWFTYPYSILEQLEKLEQLKLIEAGCIFDTFKINGNSLSIDTKEQLEEARSYSKKLHEDV